MTNEPITIRPVTIDDLAPLKKLYMQIDLQHWQARPDIFKRPHENTRTQEHIESLIADPERLTSLAIMNGAICGYVQGRLINLDTPIHQAAKIAHISEIIVEEQYFGRGVAQVLMTEVRRWAANHQATKIDLNVYAFNQRAIRFYEKEGFSTEKITMTIDLNV